MASFDETVESPKTLDQAGQYRYLGDFPLIVIASGTPIISLKDQGQIFQDL